NLNDMCQNMGLELAFDAENADFSNLGAADNGTNIYIGRVLQNCMLEVGEEGTKAAAATVVEMRCGSAFIDPSKIVNLTLDRPFVYLVIDTETQIPLFTGVYQGE
ncbi:MAG: serine protease inhibitor, partial [Peptococcaceae bacterium]|nr:serine protease inhibitor [Peptococcaceae bacterium]